MEALPFDGERFDYHRARRGLKLLKDTGDTKLLKNKEGYGCPSCGRPFALLYLSEQRENSFDPSEARPFCVYLEDDRFLLVTH